MKSPQVSVIMPTYNRTHFLATAMQSVLDQTFDDFELLVVDDGSTDATQDLLHRTRDPRIRPPYRPHRGISAAMNTGLRAARGGNPAVTFTRTVWFVLVWGVFNRSAWGRRVVQAIAHFRTHDDFPSSVTELNKSQTECA